MAQCLRSSAMVHTECSSSRLTGANRLMCTSHVRQKRRSSGLNPIRLQNSGGFSPSEINRLTKLVQEHQQDLLRESHGFFSPKRTGSPGTEGPRHR